MRPRVRLGRSLSGFAGALVLAGCSVTHVVGPTADPIGAWNTVPLMPDPALAAVALGKDSACKPTAGALIEVLIQDRRLPNTAAFLIHGPTSFGSCLVDRTGSSSGGSGPLLEPNAGPLSIDDNGRIGLGDLSARTLGGRVVAEATDVRVELADQRVVEASVVDGWWLAWWPDGVVATRVVARNDAGVVFGNLTVPR